MNERAEADSTDNRKTNLQLMHGICPACGARFERGTIICVRCGLNVKTGKRFQTRFRAESRQWGRIFSCIFFLAVVAVAVASVPRGVRWYESRMKALEDDRYARVLAHLEKMYPCFSVGETVTVRSASGAMITGVLLGSGPSGLIMQSPMGRTATLPFHMFDPAELLRFDDSLRQDVLRTCSALPNPWWQRMQMLVLEEDLDLDMTRAVERIRGHFCAACQGAGTVACKACGGRGTVPVRGEKPCPQCGGTGTYSARVGTGKSQCPFCRGVGSIPDERQEYCAVCAGRGYVPCPSCSTNLQ